MTENQMFWVVDCAEGDPDFFVCMACLNDVYRGKVPRECPHCHAISSFEPFTLDSIKDCGTEELIAKAQRASSEDSPASPEEIQEPIDPPLTEPSTV